MRVKPIYPSAKPSKAVSERSDVLPRDETRRSRFGAETTSDGVGSPFYPNAKPSESGFALETTSDGAEWMCAGRRTKRSEIHEEEATTWID